jgi:hypothetical protein
MPIDYAAVPSLYLKALIRQTPFAQHQRIDDLIRLHRHIVSGVRGWAAGMSYSLLSSRYPAEHLALLREADPAQAGEFLARQAALAESRLQDLRGELALLKERRDAWLKAGGLS